MPTPGLVDVWEKNQYLGSNGLRRSINTLEYDPVEFHISNFCPKVEHKMTGHLHVFHDTLLSGEKLCLLEHNNMI